MSPVLKRDLLGDMTDREVMQKHGIFCHDKLRRYWMIAKGLMRK